MSYGLRIHSDFTNYKSGNSKRVEIYLDGYSGSSVAPDRLGEQPLFETSRGGREDIDKHILGREMQFTFWAQKDGADYDFLLTSEYRDLLMITKTAGVIDFVGWIKSENITKGFIEGYYKYKVTATDGLADLKEEPYKNLAEVPYTGEDYFLNMIDHCLLRLQYPMDLVDLEYRIILNTYEASLMTSSECALIETYGRNRRFYKIEEGKTEADSAYKALEKLLKNFNCRIRQIGGKWFIINRNEPSSYQFEVPRDAGGFIDPSSVVRTSISNILSLNGPFKPWGEESTIHSLKGIECKLRNKSLGEAYTAVDEWNNDYTKSGMNVLSESTDHLKFEIEDTYYRLYPPEDFGSKITSSPFSVSRRTDNDYIKVSFNYRTNTYIPLFNIKSDAAFFKINLISPSGETSSMGGYLSSTFYQTFESDNIEQLKVTEDGDYQVEIAFYVNSNVSGEKVEVELGSNPEVTLVSVGDGGAVNENITFDKSFTVTQTGGRGIETTETVFGDSGNTSDAAALKDSSGNLTENWSRYGESEARPLIELYLQNRLNNRRDYMEYVTVDHWDETEQITPEKILLIGSKHYEIIGYTKDHKSSYMTLRLVQIKPHTLYGDV